MSLFDSMMLANARAAAPTPAFAFGELIAYDPTTNTGQFALPGHPDPITGVPTPTGFIQLGTPHVGANGSGAQFPPKIGAQAKIAFLGAAMDFPLFDSWYFTDQEAPPFPDGRTWGWNDPTGSSMTTTTDGPTPGDGKGAARVTAKSLAATTTSGGHQHLLDDVNKYVKTLSASGHLHILDDANQEIMTLTAGGLKTLHSDVTKEISHIPTLGGSVNLGAVKSAMTSVNAAINQSHITDYENLRQNANLQDLIANATLDHAIGIISGAQFAAKLLQLVGGFTFSIGTTGLGSGLVNIYN